MTDDKDHHEKDHENHLQGFDESAENLVKRVKQALANREGCRVLHYVVHSFFNELVHDLLNLYLRNLGFLFNLQVFGVLDVQRVAGNFHISVHGLNIFVAQMVSLP